MHPVSGLEKQMIDYLIVGAGLYGSVFARQMTDAGKKVLVIDKRDHIAGNAYTQLTEGINVHKYGAHIFHTNDDDVWSYVNRFANFNGYVHTVTANYNGELYSMPFNMYTFEKMWGVKTADEAKAIIEKQAMCAGSEDNLENHVISMVGTDIYEKLVRGYTEKQWGRSCSELPSFIIKRLPVRFEYNDGYFNAKYQGIPVGGYTAMVEKMLDGIEVHLSEEFVPGKYDAGKIVYTGPIDAYFSEILGALEYRTVRFETETLDCPDFQGCSVMNYTDSVTPYTRIIEHKHFEPGNASLKTIISKEYSSEWKRGDEPYYPVNDEKNSALYAKYKELADKEQNIIFGGRLGQYKYFDMDQVIAEALKKADEELKSTAV